VKSPPAAVLLKSEAGLAKGSGEPNKEKVGKVTKAQIRKIVEIKFADLNAYDMEQARQTLLLKAPPAAWELRLKVNSSS
jgi:large subunit ribosomal protein L11